MVILLAVMLTATVGLWIAYPFFVKEPFRSKEEAAVIHEKIEKDVERLRQQPETKHEGS